MYVQNSSYETIIIMKDYWLIDHMIAYPVDATITVVVNLVKER